MQPMGIPSRNLNEAIERFALVTTGFCPEIAASCLLAVSIAFGLRNMTNKEVALKILHSRLLNIKLEEQEKERQKIKGEHIAAEFGSQIRSYILHPYKMVKDHRTNFETKDAESVLDGKIDDFLKSYLNSKIK